MNKLVVFVLCAIIFGGICLTAGLPLWPAIVVSGIVAVQV